MQNCNDPKEWPFATIAAKVAQAQPDVVIHVGDYHYRESCCPPDQKAKCFGSPYGDTWPAWEADFFAPAAPLLASAPWVVVRGNHEDCDRAGRGWFRFLDPGPPLPAGDCNENPEPYAVKLPGLQLLVLNTSAADAPTPPDYKKAYQDLNGLAAANPAPSWLLSHHPLWAFLQSGGNLIPIHAKLQADSNNTLDANVKLVMAGHIHLFEALAFTPLRAPSIVAGMGGTKLESETPGSLVGKTIAGATVSQATVSNRFAYAIAEPKDKGWRMTVHDVNGKAVMVCDVAGAALECKGM